MASTASSGSVLITEENAVLTFTLDNQAAGNIVDGPMFDAMIDALSAQASRPSARVLRLRSKGTAFCTGRTHPGRDAVAVHAEVSRVIEFMAALRSTPLISVAEVQGDAFGFGMAMTILCDFSLVSDQATLAMPEMRRGLPPAAIIAFLGRYALPKAAFPLVLFGDDFTPQQALAAGLVTRVCRADDLALEAKALAERVLALDEEGTRHCKSFFRQAQEGTLEQNFRLGTEVLAMNSLRLLKVAPPAR